MAIPSDDKYVTGNTLRMLRLIKGFKQSTAAKKSGISQQAFSKLERSPKVGEKKFLKIATKLNCKTDDIDKVKNFTPPPINIKLLETNFNCANLFFKKLFYTIY